MEIKVLGSGCARCKSLEKAVINTLAEMNMTADVSKVEDITEIMRYGVMRTPALVINGKVILSGRIPSVNELKEILNSNLN